MIETTSAVNLNAEQVRAGEYKLYCPIANDFYWNEDYTEVTIVPVNPPFYADDFAAENDRYEIDEYDAMALDQARLDALSQYSDNGLPF